MKLFKSKKPLSQWLSEYAVSHQNTNNKKIHYICVPIIFLTIVALLTHVSIYLVGTLSILVLWFYLRLSVMLAVMMAVFLVMCIGITIALPVGVPFWVGVFVVAWIGQFLGHKIEGAKPSFFEDLQFLLIGPAWVAMSLVGKTPKNDTLANA